MTSTNRKPTASIRQLADRLEMHRLRCGNPQSGPIFASALAKPLALTSVVNRVILPALNRRELRQRDAVSHDAKTGHRFKRDARYPEWHGWHAARRGLGSNLYRLGAPEMVIQRILRHAHLSTTATYRDLVLPTSSPATRVPLPHHPTAATAGCEQRGQHQGNRSEKTER